MQTYKQASKRERENKAADKQAASPASAASIDHTAQNHHNQQARQHSKHTRAEASKHSKQSSQLAFSGWLCLSLSFSIYIHVYMYNGFIEHGATPWAHYRKDEHASLISNNSGFAEKCCHGQNLETPMFMISLCVVLSGCILLVNVALLALGLDFPFVLLLTAGLPKQRTLTSEKFIVKLCFYLATICPLYLLPPRQSPLAILGTGL